MPNHVLLVPLPTWRCAAAIMLLLALAAACTSDPTPTPAPTPTPTPTPRPTPTPTPVVCEFDSVAFEKQGSVHDDYQDLCVENGGYYLYLTLNNDTDEVFSLNLLPGGDQPKNLYSVGRKSLLDAAVALFRVCPSDCDAEQGRVRIEVDAPDAPANVEWAIRVEKKTDST